MAPAKRILTIITYCFCVLTLTAQFPQDSLNFNHPDYHGTPPPGLRMPKENYTPYGALYVGLDLFDGLYVGLGFGRGQQNMRFTLGTWFVNVVTFSGYYNHHFNGSSQLKYRKHFYVGGGYQNIFENDDGKSKYYGFVKAHLGLDINFTAKSGMQLEVGVAYKAFEPKETGFLHVERFSPTIGIRLMFHSPMKYKGKGNTWKA